MSGTLFLFFVLYFENTYSVSIPLGATINMAGAAITISVMALSAAYTVGIDVDFGTALILYHQAYLLLQVLPS